MDAAMTTAVTPELLEKLRANYARLRDMEIERRMRAEARIADIEQSIADCDAAITEARRCSGETAGQE